MSMKYAQICEVALNFVMIDKNILEMQEDNEQEAVSALHKFKPRKYSEMRPKKFKDAREILNRKQNEDLDEDRDYVRCYRCKKFGHYAATCRAERIRDEREREKRYSRNLRNGRYFYRQSGKLKAIEKREQEEQPNEEDENSEESEDSQESEESLKLGKLFGSSKSLYVFLSILGNEVKLEVDTGACVTVMSYIQYKQIIPKS